MSVRELGVTWRRFRADLRARPRQAGALALLLPLLCAAWTPILFGGEEAVAPRGPALSAPALPAASAARRAELGAVERLRPRLMRLGAPRREPRLPAQDPFARRAVEAAAPAAVPAPSAIDAASEEGELASRCVLGGTFLAPGRTAAARIDGRLVRVGEPFGVFVLDEVGPRWVSLRGRHGRYRLEMARAGGG
jgi:hypothetical protein